MNKPTQRQAERNRDLVNLMNLTFQEHKESSQAMASVWMRNKITGEFSYVLMRCSPRENGSGIDMYPMCLMPEPNLIATDWEPIGPGYETENCNTDKAIVIDTHGISTIAVPANGKTFTTEEMQKIVGGYIEIVNTSDGRKMVLNEEGKLKGLPMNEIASEMYQHGHVDHICGNVLVCPAEMIE